jgi:hypothetical protein
MTDPRSEVCPGCKGTLSVPARSRTLTLAQVRENHRVSCPQRGASRAQAVEVPDDDS